MVKKRRPPKNGFHRRFDATDVSLLAEMDALHGTLSGPATKKLMERALLIFGDERFERLSGISVSHLYNLRGGTQYQSQRRHWTKTRPTGVPIGQRRAPQPNGSPGYIRIDSVHQGDQDGVKGVYHINAVDSVTQYQLVATCERISEAYLLPVIRQLFDGFPFVILGFHSDNGSERQHHRPGEQCFIDYAGMTELPLEHPERVFHRRADRGLGVFQLFDDLAQRGILNRLHHAALGRDPELPTPLRRPLLCAGVTGVAEDLSFIAVQQVRHRGHVRHVRRRAGHGMHQPRALIHADVRLHPEVPLVAFLGLVGISASRVLPLFFVEGGAAMIVASTMVPGDNFMPCRLRCSPTTANNGSAKPCC